MKVILKGDLDNEKEFTNDLLPEGHQIVKIIEATLETSMKGNENVVIVLESCKTGGRNKFWLPTDEGKRWLLRSLIVSLNLYKKNEDNQYEFDTDDFVGKELGAFIFNVNETYTTADYKEATKKRSRIKRFETRDEVIAATKSSSAIKDETDEDEIPF
jgi:hypothetical protein